MDLENWFIIARSDQLKKTPIRRKILGKPFVLFRDSQRRPAALEDRCPHKNVALSLGKVKGDSIQCPYHGWKFNASGFCTDTPCLGPREKPLTTKVPHYSTVEQDEWIWIYPGENPIGRPPSYPRGDRVRWFELHNVMAAPPDLILENGLDCSHTGFVHKGLFRSEPKQYVSACIRETLNGMEVETLGEERGDSVDSRLLVKRGEKMFHLDTFIRPHTVHIQYTWGKSQFITILICTPEEKGLTRVYTRLGFYYPPFTRLLLPLLKFFAAKVVAQDKVILENQASQIQAFQGRSFASMDSDTPGNWLFRSYRMSKENMPAERPLRSKTVAYRL